MTVRDDGADDGKEKGQRRKTDMRERERETERENYTPKTIILAELREITIRININI